MTTRSLHYIASPKGSGLFGRAALALSAWRQRRHLDRLNDALLRDIGLTRAEAESEARRPIWDVPQHWTK